MLRALLLLSCAAAAVLPAQVQVTVPSVPAFVNVDRPFPSGIGRYQQWFSAQSLQAAIAAPMRFQQVEFFAGTTPTTQAAQIDCEVLIGHGKPFGVTSVFDNNWDSPPVLVKAQGNVPLAAGSAGQAVVTIPFAPLFTWDRVRPVLIEIRVHGNSNNNQPFVYNFRGTTQSVGSTTRVYGSGSPTIAQGNVQHGIGMIARFTARPGAVVPFGSGCPGEGGFVPVANVAQVPSPGIVWTHQLTNAAPQRFAVWVIGDAIGPPFPVDISTLFGLPASGCLLYTNVANAIVVQTVGGSAGTGIASLPVQLPPVGSYVGVSVYTQWVVFDPLAQSGLVSVTPAALSIVAPVGG